MLKVRWTSRSSSLLVVQYSGFNNVSGIGYRPQCIIRNFASRPGPSGSPKRTHPDKINYNRADLELLVYPPPVEQLSYPYVTAKNLESAKEPPRRVKMLVRDFIEDALYNPNYGYFPKRATIFNSSGDPLDFHKIRDINELHTIVAKRYAGYGYDGDGPGRQIFHTPTELFRPHYGRAIAQCLISEYLLKYFPYEDFVIYEVGAGNGTMAMDILDFLQESHPEVYERTKYTIVEISASLAKIQRNKLRQRHDCVQVVNQNILQWKKHEAAPCFVLLMEVIDNFAHDMIRYDLATLEPYQAYIAVDEAGDFFIHQTRITDPLISSFMSIRQALGHLPPLPKPLLLSQFIRDIYKHIPFAPNLSQPEYIPTRLLSLLTTLRKYFPLHHLLLSDFSSLPDTLPGYNSPVVQTRYKNTTVPCETLLVLQGYFDIFFPTNFERLRDMYEHVLSRPIISAEDIHSTDLPLPPPRASPLLSTASPLALGAEFFTSRPRNRRSPLDGIVSSNGLPVGEHKSSVFTHEEFMRTYADLDKTRLKSGENPLLDFYKNVKYLF